MKLLKIAGAVVLGLVAILIAVVTFFLGSTIKTAVEKGGPLVTGVSVKLDGARVNVFTGQAELLGLVVGNPEGFKTDSAIRVGRVKVDMDPRSVFTETVHIREILVQDPGFTFEGSLTGSNIGKLLEQIEDNTGGSEEAAEDEEKDEAPAGEEPSGKKVVIDHLRMEGAEVSLSMKIMQGVALTLPVPPVHKQDIGKEEEAGIGRVVVMVFSAILDAVLSVVTGSGELVIDAAGAVGGVAVEAVGGAAGLTVDGVKAVGSGAGAVLGGAVDLLTGGDDEASKP